MILVFLGPPGSGKGTQAKRLIKERSWPQLSTGDMLRAAISNGTKLGQEARAFMDKGQLVPDSVVIGLIQERISNDDCKKGFILDGFPRTIPQAEAMDAMLDGQSRKVDKAILFDVVDSELVKRLSGRRTCPKCNAMYHVDFTPPKKVGICDHCSTALIQRDDDKADVIEKRLQVYHKQTAPVADFYKSTGKLTVINAMRLPDQVYRDLLAALK